MKKFLSVFAFCLFAFVPFLAFAEGEIVAPSMEEFGALIAAIGGLKGATALGIVAVVVQGVMLALRSSLGSVAGKYRLLAVYLMSVVGSVVALRVAGVDLGAALMHGNTLAALQVLANQAFKQFFQKSS